MQLGWPRLSLLHFLSSSVFNSGSSLGSVSIHLIIRFGIGVTIDHSVDNKIICCREDFFGGYNYRARLYFEEGNSNAIEIAEALALWRGVWHASRVDPSFEITIACDRIATMRTLELKEGKQIENHKPFHQCLKLLGEELHRALSRHKRIRFVHIRMLGYEADDWQPDRLSRTGIKEGGGDSEFPAAVNDHQFFPRLFKFTGHQWLSPELVGEVYVELRLSSFELSSSADAK